MAGWLGGGGDDGWLFVYVVDGPWRGRCNGNGNGLYRGFTYGLCVFTKCIMCLARAGKKKTRVE